MQTGKKNQMYSSSTKQIHLAEQYPVQWRKRCTGNRFSTGFYRDREYHYTFAGWYDDTDTQVSTAANYIPQKNADGIYEAAIYTAKFTPNAVNYKVEVYLHNLTGTGYTEDTGRVQNLTGNTDAAGWRILRQ